MTKNYLTVLLLSSTVVAEMQLLFFLQGGSAEERLDLSCPVNGPELWAEEVNCIVSTFHIHINAMLAAKAQYHMPQVCLHWWVSWSWKSQNGSAGEAGQCFVIPEAAQSRACFIEQLFTLLERFCSDYAFILSLLLPTVWLSSEVTRQWWSCGGPLSRPQQTGEMCIKDELWLRLRKSEAVGG